MITTTTSGKQRMQILALTIAQGAGTPEPTIQILQNAAGIDIVATRVEAGRYTIYQENGFNSTTTIPVFSDAVTNSRQLIAIAKLAGGVTTIEGYYTVQKVNDSTLLIITYDETLTQAEMNTIIGSNKIYLPEIKTYNE